MPELHLGLHAPSQGADFGAPARNLIEEKLRSGMTLQAIEEDLKRHGQQRQAAPVTATPAPAVDQQWDKERKRQQEEEQRRQEQQRTAAAAVAAAPPAPPKPAEVGRSLGTAARNPLKLIKVGRGAPGALGAVGGCGRGSGGNWHPGC